MVAGAAEPFEVGLEAIHIDASLNSLTITVAGGLPIEVTGTGILNGLTEGSEAFVDAGGARAAGVSQFCAECLGYLDGAGATGPHARPVLHQFGWHVGMGSDPQGIVETTTARGDCVPLDECQVLTRSLRARTRGSRLFTP